MKPNPIDARLETYEWFASEAAEVLDQYFKYRRVDTMITENSEDINLQAEIQAMEKVLLEVEMLDLLTVGLATLIRLRPSTKALEAWLAKQRALQPEAIAINALLND